MLLSACSIRRSTARRISNILPSHGRHRHIPEPVHRRRVRARRGRHVHGRRPVDRELRSPRWSRRRSSRSTPRSPPRGARSTTARGHGMTTGRTRRRAPPHGRRARGAPRPARRDGDRRGRVPAPDHPDRAGRHGAAEQRTRCRPWSPRSPSGSTTSCRCREYLAGLEAPAVDPSVRAGRCRRRDHAVQLPVHHQRLEARARARRRVHGRAPAEPAHAVVRARLRRGRRRGRPARGCAQRRRRGAAPRAGSSCRRIPASTS